MPEVTVLAITPAGHRRFTTSVFGALAVTLELHGEWPANVATVTCFDGEPVLLGEAPIRDVQMTTAIVNRLLGQSRPVPAPSAL